MSAELAAEQADFVVGERQVRQRGDAPHLVGVERRAGISGKWYHDMSFRPGGDRRHREVMLSPHTSIGRRNRMEPYLPFGLTPRVSSPRLDSRGSPQPVVRRRCGVLTHGSCTACTRSSRSRWNVCANWSVHRPAAMALACLGVAACGRSSPEGAGPAGPAGGMPAMGVEVVTMATTAGGRGRPSTSAR